MLDNTRQVALSSSAMRKFSRLLAVGALTLAPASAHALTGFYAGSADGPVVSHAANVVLMREGKRTVLAMENDYVGPVQDFVIVVPVPFVVRKETVRTLPREVFAHLDQITAPRLVEYWEQDPCATTPAAPASTAPVPGAGLLKPGEAHAVSTDAQFAVGEYDITVLGTKDSAALAAYLRAAKYKLPANAEELFRPYVERGMKFFVAKVDPKKVKLEGGRAILSPLRFSYDAETLELPLRLGAALSSDGSQDLVVTVLAKGQRYEAANLPNVAIPTNLDLTDAAKAQFTPFYASLFDRTVEKNPRAAITEYAWDVTSCDACTAVALTPSELATLGSDSMPGAVVSCDPPFTLESNGHKRPKPECLVGFPVKPAEVDHSRRHADEHASDLVMSRLHLRYGKEPLPDDLVLRAGAPLSGGREIVSSDNTLEHGAQAAKTNHFQARYAVRHAWAGAIACKEPHRGTWGGPPAGTKADALAKAALEVAFAPHGTAPVDGFVSPASLKDLDGLAIAQPAQLAKPLVTDASADASPVLPTDEAKAGCKACTLQASSAPSSPGALALLGLALLGLRRRR